MGKQNMFVFGVDANDVPRLREERKNFKDYDPRWTAVMKSLLSGTFGDKTFFQVLCCSCLCLYCFLETTSCHKLPCSSLIGAQPSACQIRPVMPGLPSSESGQFWMGLCCQQQWLIQQWVQDVVDNVNDMTKSNDYFLVANDFATYLAAQDEVDRIYRDQVCAAAAFSDLSCMHVGHIDTCINPEQQQPCKMSTLSSPIPFCISSGMHDMTGQTPESSLRQHCQPQPAICSAKNRYVWQDEWTRRSIMYTATSGFFSSDRCISQYANEIWDVKPVPVPY